MMLVVLACFCAFTTAAYATDGDLPTENEGTQDASLLNQAKEAGSELWSTVKEKAPGWTNTAKDKISDAADTVREKAPGVWEDVKDTAADAADKIQEKAPEVIDDIKEGVENAQETVSDWNASQQDQFWQWFDRQTGMNTTGKVNPSEKTDNADQPDEEPDSTLASPDDDAAPSDDAQAEQDTAKDTDSDEQAVSGEEDSAQDQAAPDTTTASGDTSTSTENGTLVATKEQTNSDSSNANGEPETPEYIDYEPDTTVNYLALFLIWGGGLVLIIVIAMVAVSQVRRYNRRRGHYRH